MDFNRIFERRSTYIMQGKIRKKKKRLKDCLKLQSLLGNYATSDITYK